MAIKINSDNPRIMGMLQDHYSQYVRRRRDLSEEKWRRTIEKEMKDSGIKWNNISITAVALSMEGLFANGHEED